MENQERGAYCFRSHRCVSVSQTQSVNRRLRSGKSGSPLTKKPKRSQSSSPGLSQPLLWRSPIAAPQHEQETRTPSRFIERCPHCGWAALGCAHFHADDPRREVWTGK